LIERLASAPESGEQLAGRLSGGNQQKVVLAKWLFRKARVFLFDEPTRGIDVAAKAEVFALLDELAAVGRRRPHGKLGASRITAGGRPYPGDAGRPGIAKELVRPTTQEEILRHAVIGD